MDHDHENGLIRREGLISKFKTSLDGKQIITMNIFTNISRSKGNQVIEIAQLIDYNMMNIFLEKSYKKYSGEANPRSKLNRSLDQQSEMI